MNRREFLEAGALGLGGLVVGPRPMQPLSSGGSSEVSDWVSEPEIGGLSGGKLEEVIGGWAIGGVTLVREGGTAATSAGLAPNDYPFYAGAAYADRATAPYRVTTAGVLNATGVIISGAITSTSGTIGGFTLGATTISATGIGLGSSAVEPYINLPTGLSEYSGNGFLVFYTIATANTVVRAGTYSAGALVKGIHWNGSDLVWKATNTSLDASGNLTATSATISGAITASSGSVGSFTIGTYLYTGTKTAWNDTNAGVHIGSDGIGIGNNVFTVNGSTGALVATSATITGAITASSGSITGPLTMSGASASIAIGTTPPSSATVGTGLWLDRTGLYGLNANTQEFYVLASDGKAYFAGGNGWIDANGLVIKSVAGATSYFRFWDGVTAYPDARMWYDTTATNAGFELLNNGTGAVVSSVRLTGTGVNLTAGILSVSGTQISLDGGRANIYSNASPGTRMTLFAEPIAPGNSNFATQTAGYITCAETTGAFTFTGPSFAFSGGNITLSTASATVDGVDVSAHTHGGAGQGGTVAVASVTGAAPLASPTFTGTVTIDDLYTVDWTDYSGISTIAGWSSFTTKHLRYRKVGHLVFVHFNLAGVASGTSVTFTLPYAVTTTFDIQGATLIVDNSVQAATPGWLVAAGSSVTLYRDLAGTAWTNSGNRTSTGIFFYPTAS